MKFITITRLLTLLALSTINAQLATRARAQGSLTPPPGAPAPTMKTLDQVEARTPVNATTCPGDATHLFIISQPGSYYLTGNITGVTGKHGLRISNTNVTLDLNGFALSSSLAEALMGIEITATDNVSIMNGTLSGWGHSAIYGPATSTSTFEKLRVMACSAQAPEGVYFAVEAYRGCTARHCVFSKNLLNGIKLQNGSLVEHCTASENTKSGIATGPVCQVRDCVATHNKMGGILTDPNCNIVDCTASYNTGRGIWADRGCLVSRCVAIANSTKGIEGYEGCQVVDCVANDNTEEGISVSTYAMVRGCVASNNGTNLGGNIKGIGIHATGTGNRIEGNLTRFNLAHGIKCDGGPGADYILQNTSGSNGVNYFPNTGTSFAPVQPLSTQTNPSANH